MASLGCNDGYFAMSVSTSTPLNASPNSATESTAELLHLKRRLVATRQELDEARGGRPKKILWF